MGRKNKRVNRWSDKHNVLREALKNEGRMVTNLGTIHTHVDSDRLQDIPIAVGYRPSGRIHLGNVTTFLIAARIAQSLGNHRSHLHVTNCDLELPGRDDIQDIDSLIPENVRAYTGTQAMHFRHLYPLGSSDPLSVINQQPVSELLEKLRETKRVQSDHVSLSLIQSEHEYRDAIKRFCERIEAIADYFPDQRGEILKRSSGGEYVFPICGDCRSANMNGAKYEEGKLTATCKPCDKVIETDIYDPDTELAVHFLLDPLRDLSTSVSSELHVFGGDYGEEIPRNFSKLEKMAGIMSVVHEEGEKLPLLYCGPMIYAEDGKKMGKSTGNGLAFDKIARVHDNPVEALWNYVGHVLHEGMRHVDFSITKKYLL